MFRYILLALLFATNSLFAQTQKGSWMAGGSGSFSNTVTSGTTLNSTSFSVTPKVGLFLADNFAFGLGLNYAYSYSKSSTPSYSTDTYNFSALSFARYYFGKSKFRTFLDGELGYGKLKQDVNFGGSTDSNEKSGAIWAAGLGAAYFLNDKVAIETTLRYAQTLGGLANQNTSLQFNVGFQIFFPKKTE